MASRGSLTWCWSSVATMATMRLANRRARAESAMACTLLQLLLRRSGLPNSGRLDLCTELRPLLRRVRLDPALLVMRPHQPAPGGQQLDLHLTGDLAFTGVQHPVHLG